METNTKHDGSALSAGVQPVSDAIDRASSGLQSAIDEASSAARPAVRRLSDEAHAVVNRLAGAADRASDSLQETGAQFGRARQQFGTSARGLVSEHPLSAIGIAVAAGFLISRFVRTR